MIHHKVKSAVTAIAPSHLWSTALILTAAIGLLFMLSPQNSPALSSAETRFVEKSANGMQIVPASCPSNPHSSGECTPPSQPSAGCTMTASPSTINSGQSSVIGWSSDTDYADPYTRTISPTIGGVAWSGTWNVAPTQTTTYTLTATHSSSGSNYSCNTTVTVIQPAQTCTPTYSCQGNDLYYTNASCSNSLVQACAWGCSYGACLLPPDPTGDITANPALVRSGKTSEIVWEAENVESCTVTENNPDINDSWTGVTGTRTSSAITQLTTYTLRCIDLSGEEFLDYAKVNVIPIWEEQ